MNKPVLFIGSNGNLSLYVETAQRQGLVVEGILDSDYFGNTECIHNIPVIGSEHDIEKFINQYDFFISTNWSPDPAHTRDVQKRKHLISLVENLNIQCINIIDPSAQVSPSAKLGHGIYIGSMSYIEPGVEIDSFSQVYFGVGISHGSRIGKNTIIQRQAGIAGLIGDNCYIGMWSKVFKPGLIKIGNNVIVNPGLYVARDVLDGEHIKLNKESVKTYQYLIQTV